MWINWTTEARIGTEGVFGSEERGGKALKRSVGLLDENHLTKISSLVEVELAVDVNCLDLAAWAD